MASWWHGTSGYKYKSQCKGLSWPSRCEHPSSELWVRSVITSTWRIVVARQSGGAGPYHSPGGDNNARLLYEHANLCWWCEFLPHAVSKCGCCSWWMNKMPHALMNFVSLIPKAQQIDQTPPPEWGGDLAKVKTRNWLNKKKNFCSLQTKGEGHTHKGEGDQAKTKTYKRSDSNGEIRIDQKEERGEAERFTKPPLPLRL